MGCGPALKLVFNEKEDEVEYPDKVCIEAGLPCTRFRRYRVKAEGFVYQVRRACRGAIEKGGRYRGNEMKIPQTFFTSNGRPMDTKKEFDDSFKAKYGKTYIEAEDDIRDAMFRGCADFCIWHRRNRWIFWDFGTAYGTFLVSCCRNGAIRRGENPGIVKAAQKLGGDVTT
jgi:hypothetical protein